MVSGVIHVKHDGAWKAVNFDGQGLDVNDGGTWKEPTASVKVSGTWRQVYPSDLEAWTASNACTVASEQGSSNKPTVDPAFPATNLPTGVVAWTGRSDGIGSGGEWVRGGSFGWSPLTIAGFSYGAVLRLEVSFDAKLALAPAGSHTYVLKVSHYTSSTTKNVSVLTTSYVTSTLDFTVDSWGMTHAEAGGLHLSGDYIKLQPLFNNATLGVDNTLSIRNFRARLKYAYN